MSNIYKYVSTKRLTAIAALCCCIILADKGAPRAGTYENAGQGNCAFSLRLTSDPYARTQYLMSLNYATKGSLADSNNPESMYGHIVPADYGKTVEIDSFSYDCITCHDGMNASSYQLRFKNDARDRQIDINSVIGSHPIGMHYKSYTYENRELKEIQNPDSGMILVNGKVGCLTCHNPLNPDKNHLVMSNVGSKLCFSCHNK